MTNTNQATTNTPAQQTAALSRHEWHKLKESNLPMMFNRLASLSRTRELPMEGLNLSHTPHTWDAYFLPDPKKQVLTPAQIMDACATIRENVRLGVSGNTEINFVDFTQRHSGDSYCFGDAVLAFLPLGGFYHPSGTVICSFSDFYHHDMRVLIGDYAEGTRAFMEARSDECEDYIGELSQAYMLTTFMVDDGHLGISTMFHKDYGSMDFSVMADMSEISKC